MKTKKTKGGKMPNGENQIGTAIFAIRDYVRSREGMDRIHLSDLEKKNLVRFRELLEIISQMEQRINVLEAELVVANAEIDKLSWKIDSMERENGEIRNELEVESEGGS